MGGERSAGLWFLVFAEGSEGTRCSSRAAQHRAKPTSCSCRRVGGGCKLACWARTEKSRLCCGSPCAENRVWRRTLPTFLTPVLTHCTHLFVLRTKIGFCSCLCERCWTASRALVGSSGTARASACGESNRCLCLGVTKAGAPASKQSGVFAANRW